MSFLSDDRAVIKDKIPGLCDIKPFNQRSIYSFNHYLLRRYFVSGTVLGTLDTKLNKKNQSCVGFQLFPNS